MFSADDLLDVLRRRRTLKSIRPEVPGRLPPGWERWLAAMPAHGGSVTGAPPHAWIDVLAARPLRSPPRRGPPLTRWQAFGTLWRQQWHAAGPDERGLRIFAMAASLVVHACFAVMLAWLMYLHLLLLPVPEPQGEGHVVQVEYVGRGTPEAPGGGEAPPVVPEPADVAVPRVAAAAAAAPAVEPAEAEADTPELPELPVAVAAPAVAPTMPPVPRRDVPAPTPVEAAQPLQVTEVAEPDIDFVLPPPTVRVDPVARRELVVPSRDVPEPEVVEAVEADLPPGLPTVAVQAPETSRPVLAVPRREVPAPAVATTVPAPAAPDTTDGADAGTPVAEGAQADAVADAGDAPEGRDASSPERAAGATDALAGEGAPSTGGTGPATVPRPGGWPSPSRGDDWDDALRNRPGSRAGEGGVFDGTGRPNLAGTGGSGGPPGGAPPGSSAREAIDLEKGGTWLRRPPLDYRPTRFDRFWIPSGTLLEEWVRRGIKQMAIPIPGTSKEIVCVVSILQLGGGCGLRDPNLNEEPSTGRAAPDVPFKPELQEDQDAVARPPGG